MTTRSSSDLTCPPLKAYPREFLLRAADELEALPENSPLSDLIVDYQGLRAACRALTQS